jgi:hypothetical protein
MSLDWTSLAAFLSAPSIPIAPFFSLHHLQKLDLSDNHFKKIEFENVNLCSPYL